MGQPQKKPSDPQQSFQVVEGGVHKETRALTFFFLVLATLGTVTVLYFAQQTRVRSLALADLYEWHFTLSKWGTAKFDQQKDKFREQIQQHLNTRHASAELIGLTLYLFPELLTDADFQKYEAQQLWVPHQKQIEAAPRTLESRIQFERMRTNVWNFELADKANPVLTRPARQMLRVYDELSRPE